MVASKNRDVLLEEEAMSLHNHTHQPQGKERRQFFLHNWIRSCQVSTTREGTSQS